MGAIAAAIIGGVCTIVAAAVTTYGYIRRQKRSQKKAWTPKRPYELSDASNKQEPSGPAHSDYDPDTQTLNLKDLEDRYGGLDGVHLDGQFLGDEEVQLRRDDVFRFRRMPPKS